jgi:hypothetical protein
MFVLLACIETLSKGYVFRGQGQFYPPVTGSITPNIGGSITAIRDIREPHRRGATKIAGGAIGAGAAATGCVVAATVAGMPPEGVTVAWGAGFAVDEALAGAASVPAGWLEVAAR